MALDLTGLSQWVRESGDKADMIIKAFLADPSLEYVDKHNKVKGEVYKSPIISTTGTATNAHCSTTDTDNLTITQFAMSGNYKNYRNSLCLSQLDSYFTQQWHNGDTLTVLDDVYNKEIALKIIGMAKKYAWLNNISIAALPADFKEFDGLLKKIDTGVGVYTHTIAAGKTLGIANDATHEKISDVIEDLYNNLPEAATVGQDIVAFVPPSVFQQLKLIVKNDNLFHYKMENIELNKYVMVYPGISNLLIVATDGLSNTAVSGQDNSQKDRIVMTNVGNIAIALDEQTINENTKIFYDEFNSKLLIKTEYWIATGVKFFDFVATSKRS